MKPKSVRLMKKITNSMTSGHSSFNGKSVCFICREWWRPTIPGSTTPRVRRSQPSSLSAYS